MFVASEVKAVAEALRQVRDGMDFSAPKSVLKISPARAVTKQEGWPYSIGDNIAHADFWQRLWLARLTGETRPKMDEKLWDWPTIAANEWADVRRQFLVNLDEAIEIASAEPFVHCMKDEGAAEKTLLEIAVHDAYHIGQCVLLKRLLA